MFAHTCSSSLLDGNSKSFEMPTALLVGLSSPHLFATQLLFFIDHLKSQFQIHDFFFSFAFEESLSYLKTFDFLLRRKIGCKFFVK